ncbi:hypothetical protein, partial [Nocardia carnea]|uniref:hypothetical protein n=1 Tax=Nocardia carnea TaxID=37328 RepID=UPI002455D154
MNDLMNPFLVFSVVGLVTGMSAPKFRGRVAPTVFFAFWHGELDRQEAAGVQALIRKVFPWERSDRVLGKSFR